MTMAKKEKFPQSIIVTYEEAVSVNDDPYLAVQENVQAFTETTEVAIYTLSRITKVNVTKKLS
jgi:hypothetical protein